MAELRTLERPFVAPCPTGVAIRTRLRPTTAEDAVLRQIGAYLDNLTAGIATIRARLARPLGEPGTTREPGGYRSRNEWFQKSRRLVALQSRRDRQRGPPRRADPTRHHPAAALGETVWGGRDRHRELGLR